MLGAMRSSSPVVKAALIVSVLALVVATTGGAIAAFKLKKNAVRTKNIRNGAVTSSKLADQAVTTQKLGEKAVTGAKIADGAVGPGQLAAGAVPAAPRAFVRYDDTGTLVASRGLVGEQQPASNTACLDLSFTPTTAVGSRGILAGSTPHNAALVGVGDEARLVCPAGFQDAVIQVVASGNVLRDVTAWFE